MLNFIVCEDNNQVREMNEQMINKIMFNNNLDYKIYSFSKYNDDLKNIIQKQIGKKVYILDIELGSKSGIEIAREIREKDWESTIVMATAHSELFPQMFKDRLMLFDFVSKFDDFNNNMSQALIKIIKIYESTIPFSFKIRKTNYRFRYDEILYLLFDNKIRKTIVKTVDNKYVVSKPMSYLSEGLPKYFIKINKHCIINKNNLKSYCTKGKLNFKNSEELSEKIFNNKEIEEYVLD